MAGYKSNKIASKNNVIVLCKHLIATIKTSQLVYCVLKESNLKNDTETTLFILQFKLTGTVALRN